jgi:hypothetical protein
MADRYSGYPLVEGFASGTSAASTIRVLRKVFAQYGCPERLFSDGGLQFTAQETQDFLVDWGVGVLTGSSGC